MPPNKYAAPVKLKDLKLMDLKALLPYIPPEHKSFLEDIISEQEGMKHLLENPDDQYPDNDFLDYC